jgi:hypothetical protein
MLLSMISLPLSLPKFSVHNSRLFSLSTEEERLNRGWTYIFSFSIDSLGPSGLVDRAWRKLQPPKSGFEDVCLS